MNSIPQINNILTITNRKARDKPDETLHREPCKENLEE
jgi:hypothetical protein